MITLKEKLLSLGFFVDNKYLDFYCTLVEDNLKTPIVKGLTEKHHIIQRQIYRLLGNAIDNSSENIINSSHFDHCKAHYYLCLCTSNNLKYSNQHAFMRMVKIKARFEDFDFDKFLLEADKYNEIYKDFRQNQSDLNKKSCLKRGGGTNIGKHSYTNGIKNVFSAECPEGFWPGRTVKVNKSDETKKRYCEAAKLRASNPGYKNKLKERLVEYYKTHKGTCSGKVWITNDIQDTYIPKDEPLPEGWRYGRKKFSDTARMNISKGHIGKNKKN